MSIVHRLRSIHGLKWQETTLKPQLCKKKKIITVPSEGKMLFSWLAVWLLSARELAANARENWGTQAMNYAGKQNAKNPTILPSSSLLRSRSGRSHAEAGSLRDTGPERLQTRLTFFLCLRLLFKRSGTYY